MWARRALGFLGVLALAACATREPLRPQSAARVLPTASRVASTPTPAPAWATAPAAVPVPAATQSVAPGPHYANLFARIRAGFQLPDPNMPVIAEEARWYANHPKFLQRAFGRADMYLYYIVRQLQARHMPLELSLLPVIESAFQPYAYSWARAAGIWQFTSGTGRLFGLKQDWWYDGRLDVVASTNAALNYLQQLHDQLGGHWLLAIAAYNCGVLTVQRAMQINRAEGRPTDFWDLNLPRQTELYVPQLLAMARLVKDPAKYGLSFSPIPDKPFFERVATGGQINLEVAAQLAGISSDEIYQLNPAFHRWATDPTGPFYLLLPVNTVPEFTQNLAALSPDERMGVEQYVVRRGDTVYSVARRFKTTMSILYKLNDLPGGRLVVGQSIEVPASDYRLPSSVLLADARIAHAYWQGNFRVVRVRPGDSLWTIAQRNGMSVQRLAQINGISPQGVLWPGEQLRLYADAQPGRFTAPRFWVHTVRVRPGETLWSIAQRHGMTVNALASLNGIYPNQIIRPGEQLRLTADAQAAPSRSQQLTASVVSVRPGQTLWSIAQRHGMTVSALASLNGIYPNQILRPGEQLRLTADAQAASSRSQQLTASVVSVRPGQTLWSIAQRHGMTVSALASLNGIHPNQVLQPGERLRISAGVRAAGRMLAGVGRGVRRVIYTVQAGDTLWQIAQRFQVRVAQILAWNEMSLRRPILAGEKLMILADSGG